MEAHNLPVPRDGKKRSAADLLSVEGVSVQDCMTIWPDLAAIPKNLHSQLETDCRYSGYLRRQQADISAMRRDEALLIPESIDYTVIGGLSAESQDLLKRHAPETIAQANRIAGLTPAAIVALIRYIRRGTGDTSQDTNHVESKQQKHG